MTDNRPRPSAAWTAVAVLLCLCLYVLSYAPAYRVIEGSDAPSPSYGFCCWPHYDQRPWESTYVPVMLLMDHTPLARPLLAWAEVWQVDGSFCNGLLMRTIERAMIPYDYDSHP